MTHQKCAPHGLVDEDLVGNVAQPRGGRTLVVYSNQAVDEHGLRHIGAHNTEDRKFYDR